MDLYFYDRTFSYLQLGIYWMAIYDFLFPFFKNVFILFFLVGVGGGCVFSEIKRQSDKTITLSNRKTQIKRTRKIRLQI